MNIALGCTSRPVISGRAIIDVIGFRPAVSFHHCCSDIRLSAGCDASTNLVAPANTARQAFRLRSQHDTSRLSISTTASRSNG
ncbi:hypothetical protein [Antrihabitans cavernicola]|uniref:Uncharacterized protein n=1 Tax=Antrihabitans cavernicola TaxID=2495913 RepID=A0A5A7S7I4_9NOCA|nr:hypothetical protein [Spelaeibacter cavernicola]KAA0017648.1 hypothetical protein FOY51_24705 [Spelaeibacter cavernicola]